MKVVDALPREWIQYVASPRNRPSGDDVVISLPDEAIGLEHSMKVLDERGGPKIHPVTDKGIQKKFEFRTALPVEGTGIPDDVYRKQFTTFIGFQVAWPCSKGNWKIRWSRLEQIMTLPAELPGASIER